MAVESYTAGRFRPFGTTIFAEMTRLAMESGAINLSQGFPDFDGPEFVKEAVGRALAAGHNQYAPMGGVPALTSAIAERWERDTGIGVDSELQVTVTDGCTEALAASFLGLVNPGDEVILFEPYYDSYRACVAMAGATARFVGLRAPATDSPPDAPFTFDEQELRSAFNERTRVILVNTPHNPTGKVFTRGELELIASLCLEHDVIAITDEVYERLVFDEKLPHYRLATFEGMGERTLTLSSLGKTFSFTGWKIGWAIGSPALTAGIRSAHQFLTYAVATPLQHAAAEAIRHGDAYIAELVGHYRKTRDYLAGALSELGFGVSVPAGTYFLMADHSPFGFADDVAFCQHLATEVGVAAIPPTAFYERKELGRHLARFAFCKRMETMERAVERLGGLRK